MVSPMEDQFVSSSEAAKLLGAAHITVTQLCQQGKLPAIKVANRWLIRSDALDELQEGIHHHELRYKSSSPKHLSN